eukprot:scaffold193807_cov31-Tisochrysis_lutea.AAC.1
MHVTSPPPFLQLPKSFETPPPADRPARVSQRCALLGGTCGDRKPPPLVSDRATSGPRKKRHPSSGRETTVTRLRSLICLLIDCSSAAHYSYGIDEV